MDFEKSYIVPAPREETYAAWVSSGTVIEPSKRMHIEPWVGGVYQLFMTPSGSQPDCQGFFADVLPNERLRYGWQWSGEPEQTEITVTFRDNGANTEITIQHQGFETHRSLDLHADGWDSYVAGLTQLLTPKP